MSERLLVATSRDGGGDFISPKIASAMVVVLPVGRLARGLLAAVMVLAAAAGGFRLAAGPGALGALLPERGEARVETAFLDLPEVIVNLHPEARSRYLKIALTLEVPAGQRARAQALEPQMMNAVQEFLRGLDDEDLGGSADLSRLRDELARRLRLVSGDVEVADVLLRNLLTQ
ncbi:flagellar basal body-associated FliL family protein [Arenibaculum sp.]|uniref:flagellar basal body-associated FliL family protein n=1 Tax=Arenibaculum sp. TaxID=2865862 RepID=UPI002E0F9A4C|nr:flagellar basal body-associated FliL family protein [Arenibaculum sp.]